MVEIRVERYNGKTDTFFFQRDAWEAEDKIGKIKIVQNEYPDMENFYWRSDDGKKWHFYQSMKENRKVVRKQLMKLLYEADLGADLGMEEVDQEKEKDIKQLKQNRHDEIVDIIGKTFFRLKNDTEIIRRYRDLYKELHHDNDQTMTDFYEKLYRDLKDMYKQQWKLTGIDSSVLDIFDDLLPMINDEFEKAYVNIKERVSETGAYK